MGTNYWTKTVSRRRAMRGAALVGAGLLAPSILSCGSDGGGEPQTGLISEPGDTTGQAKRGGIHQSFAAQDEANIDPFTTSRGGGRGGAESPGYQKLLREKAVAGGTTTQTFIGDAAESYELADGGLRLVAKLRPNNKFDPRPPTNGRAMNAQDVVYSWNRLEAQSTYASVLSYKRSEGAAPIESVTAVDDRTVVYRMAFPWSALLPGIAEGGPHQIGPVEAEEFNPRNTIRGSGPWMLDYEPSVSYKWRRNPGYFDSQFPFLDGYDEPIVSEYAARLAQFRAKQIWDFAPSPSDLPQFIQDLSGMQVYQGLLSSAVAHIWFSGHATNPFRDVRMRRAVSMALDRELYAEVISESEKLRAIGLPVTNIIDNNVAGGDAEYYLDPFGKEMGEAAQYFKHNVPEAKKLVAAAGYPNGVDLLWKGSSNHNTRVTEILTQMIAEAGLRTKQEIVNYTSVYLPNVLSARGDWEGDITMWGSVAPFTIATNLQRIWHPTGGTTRVSCFTKACDDDHAKIAALIEKALREVDASAYKSQIHELQRLMGLHQGAISYNYSSTPFSLIWPWVKNWQVWRLSRAQTRYHYVWADEELRRQMA